jgi:hypothetical protein
MVHSPQITEKNEFNLGGHISSSVLEAHTSYSPINNWALILSTSVTGNSITVLNNIDGAIGYYNKINEHLFYETYLGYGHGNTYKENCFYFKGGDKSYIVKSAEYHKFFGQAALIITEKKFVTASIGTRFNYVDFYNMKSRYEYTLPDKLYGFYIDPFFSLRSGIQLISIQAQFGYSFDVLKKYDITFKPSVIFGLGIIFSPSYPAYKKLKKVIDENIN